ncbi:hypothetical protein BOX15_Mlig024983g1 [Macrostomum lignano]|uniref:Zgc: n=2 Tax=Macrostomum lignano TaxID=282301 RepID=A0A1I8I0S4_9PLAT|nr:hypothetical protein BOX15_Mlig024983g1 [Macrostomum lignano]
MTSSAIGLRTGEDGKGKKSTPSFGACGGAEVCGLAVAAAGCSGVSCLLLALSVCTAYWESVTFDFGQVNRTLAAAGSTQWQQPRPLFSESGQQTGLVLLPAGNSTANGTATGFCLLNVYASMWSLCDRVNSASGTNSDYSDYCSTYSMLIRNNTCFSYISGYSSIRDLLDKTENSSESQIMKMQNNAMACCIVVLLCVAASMVTGAIGLLARVVPSIMVTSVLNLTAGIFIVFSNSIQHEKVARMIKKPQIDACPQCACYSLIKTPEMFCNSTHRSASLGWSVITAWVAAGAYLATAGCWLALTRRIRIEKSKTMV